MNAISAPQERELEADLRILTSELSDLLTTTRTAAKPVDLEQPIGRLSRMDAMAQQKMLESNRRSAKQRLQLVAAALARFDTATYGGCRECDEPIGYKRLKARPETPLCITCQTSTETST